MKGGRPRILNRPREIFWLIVDFGDLIVVEKVKDSSESEDFALGSEKEVCGLGFGGL